MKANGISGRGSVVAAEPVGEGSLAPSSPNVFNLVRDIIYEPDALMVAGSLVRTDSYHVDMNVLPNDWVEWSSGIKAPCYCDCRRLNYYPMERSRVELALTQSVQSSFAGVELIIGMATAGIPWAHAVATNLGLPLAYVRSTPKEHGMGGMVECSPASTDKAIIIDDLVASGKSVLAGVNALSDEAGVRVIGVSSIVNWGFSEMRSSLAQLKVSALTSFPQILTMALADGRIGHEDFTQLTAFYQNPTTHIWRPCRRENEF